MRPEWGDYNPHLFPATVGGQQVNDENINKWLMGDYRHVGGSRLNAYNAPLRGRFAITHSLIPAIHLRAISVPPIPPSLLRSISGSYRIAAAPSNHPPPGRPSADE